MRPRYETEQDRMAALRAAQSLIGLYGLKSVELAKAEAPVNVIGSTDDGDDIGIEVKCPNYPMRRLDAMGGVFIAQQKWKRMEDLSRKYDVDVWHLVRAEDGLWLCMLGRAPFRSDGFTTGGRSDRGDPHDVERMALLRMARYELVLMP